MTSNCKKVHNKAEKSYMIMLNCTEHTTEYASWKKFKHVIASNLANNQKWKVNAITRFCKQILWVSLIYRFNKLLLISLQTRSCKVNIIFKFKKCLQKTHRRKATYTENVFAKGYISHDERDQSMCMTLYSSQ